MFRSVIALALVGCCLNSTAQEPGQSVARQWNEQLLWAIRLDSARPTVHARNLFHISAAMWDAWAAYDDAARAVIHHENMEAEDPLAARREAISYAAYRMLLWRFQRSPNFVQTESSTRILMKELGYDPAFVSTEGTSAAALGNRVARSVIAYGLSDGANEQADYANRHYQPVNPPLAPTGSGNPGMVDPDRWQALDIPDFVGQSGEQSENYPLFVGPEWGNVKPFSLDMADSVTRNRDGNSYRIFMDPGPPPLFDGPDGGAAYRAGFEQVIEFSSRLDLADGLLMDASPAGRGNSELGRNDGPGHAVNPVSGRPYKSQWVYAGDYYRVLAEFWADGPSSETPPGHWFVILNFATDRMKPGTKRFAGEGRILDNLEWDLRSYLALGGAMHDVAIAAWSSKGWYDYPRPVSAIRYLCELGQRSDRSLPDFNEQGINLRQGLIEVISSESSAPGQRHAHLVNEHGEGLGKIAVKAWRGPDHVPDPKSAVAGVGWIMCADWWPYQRPNFVTPPFAGYVSGHSTYSRAAAEILTLMTGSSYFPDGIAVFTVPESEYLRFERGPSKTFQLQWATYRDAADESAISRIYGGIHPTGDDVPGRKMGYKIGHLAFVKALTYFPD